MLTQVKTIYYFNKEHLNILILTLLFSLWTATVFADEPDTLFRSEEIINLELRSDFTAIEKSRTGDAEYFDGELIYDIPGSEPEIFSVKVMVRGHFRRDPNICSFPPLLVNFKGKEVKNTIFDNQNKLKLVTPCQNEEDVVEEYLIYKMYNQVTDLSMKVRLAKIRYYDTATGRRLFEKYSFFVEDKDKVAKRNDAIAKDRFLTPFDLNQDNFKKVALFEYLIGNKDWYVTSRKNLEILQSEDPSIGLIAVPYDFDLSGFVDPDYSKPEGVPEYALADKRVYKGLCYTDDELKDTFDYFRNLKPVFESIINNQELIPKYNRKQIIKYIDISYSYIENEHSFKKVFANTCQSRKDFNLADLQNSTTM
jgi:hypothetical protein